MQSDANHPWLRPVWRRILIVAITAGIALWDILSGNFGWALIFGGMAAYGVYVFFIAWKGDETPPPGDKD